MRPYLVPLTGLDYTIVSASSSRRRGTVHRTVPLDGFESSAITKSRHPSRVSAFLVPPTGIEPVRFLGRGILSAKTHSERSGIRLHQNESISYASSCIFLIFQSFFTQKLFVCLYFWEFFQNSLEHKFDAIFEPLEGCLEGCWRTTL